MSFSDDMVNGMIWGGACAAVSEALERAAHAVSTATATSGNARKLNEVDDMVA
ncbi:MAG TPA: hypothetical protein VGD27_10315 [Longimicrobiales bacterium]